MTDDVRAGHDEVQPSSTTGTDRRTVLRAAGGAGLLGAVAALTGRTGASAALAGTPASGPTGLSPSGSVCALTPESIEGPFYLPDELIRDDIREDRRGVTLRLRFLVVDADTCEPLPRAAVDIWHCDALGEYSGVAKRAEGEDTAESSSFLRGIQLTTARGRCDFTTIIPGWYPGRATHIHTKVHVGGEAADHHYVGGHVVHTGQVFFAERVMGDVERVRPYSQSSTSRVHNKDDAYFQQSGGSSAVVEATPYREGHPRRGYLGTMTLAVVAQAGF